MAAANACGVAPALLCRHIRRIGAHGQPVERPHLACVRGRPPDGAHRGLVRAAALDLQAQRPRGDLPARDEGREEREAREPRAVSQPARHPRLFHRRLLRCARAGQGPGRRFRCRRSAAGAARRAAFRLPRLERAPIGPGGEAADHRRREPRDRAVRVFRASARRAGQGTGPCADDGQHRRLSRREIRARAHHCRERGLVAANAHRRLQAGQLLSAPHGGSGKQQRTGPHDAVDVFRWPGFGLAVRRALRRRSASPGKSCLRSAPPRR